MTRRKTNEFSGEIQSLNARQTQRSLRRASLSFETQFRILCDGEVEPDTSAPLEVLEASAIRLNRVAGGGRSRGGGFSRDACGMK